LTSQAVIGKLLDINIDTHE